MMKSTQDEFEVTKDTAFFLPNSSLRKFDVSSLVNKRSLVKSVRQKFNFWSKITTFFYFITDTPAGTGFFYKIPKHLSKPPTFLS